MKILCVCNGGHVRSVTLARLLRKRGHEVLSCGVNSSYKDDTLTMLFNWAEKIIIQKDSAQKLEKRALAMNGSLLNSIRFGNDSKFDFRFDVGPDDWKVPQHPDLLAKMRKMVENIPIEEGVLI
jgi:predicted protein tyrosine phosphatase